MATIHLTDAIVRRLEPPTTGNRITYDSKEKGFGARVTANGAKSFVLTYTVRSTGRQRRYTIGGCDHWTATDARRRVKDLKAEIDRGGDPLRDLQVEREAPTMGDLIARFREEHFPHMRPSSALEYERMLRNYVIPYFSQHTKVTDVRFEDIDALHRKVTKVGYRHRANRLVAVLSKMFALSVKWKMRTDNPCKGIERNTEHNRRRYIKPDELARLTEALATFPDQEIADAIRMLLLTGSRKSEVCSMKWDDLDLTAGTWSKPPASTKQDQHHQVPLSAPARTLLAARLAKRDDSPYVFPGRLGSTRHLSNIWHAWQRLCRDAKITGLRPHDLRHSFASQLASGGASLLVIGELLGHSQPKTTARYAHLFDDPLRKATEQVGAIIENAGKPSPEPPVRLRGRS